MESGNKRKLMAVGVTRFVEEAGEERVTLLV